MKRPTLAQLEWGVLAVFGLWTLVLLARAAVRGHFDRADLLGFVWLILAAGAGFVLLLLGAGLLEAWRRLTGSVDRPPDAADDGLLRRFLLGKRGARLERLPGGGELALVPYRDETVGVSVLEDGRVAAWVPVDGEQTHSLDLGRTTLPQRVKTALGIDQRGPDALAGLVIDKEAEEALRLLFGPFQCRRLWLSEGRLHAETGLASSVISAGWVDQVLDGLFHVGALLDSMKVVVRRATPRSADRTLCPFCHDEVSATDATPCPACGTAHHTECWEEAAGCTILGCARNPRRGPPVRAR